MSIRLAKAEDIDQVYEICLSIKEIYKKNNIDLWNDEYPLKEDFVEDLLNNGLYVHEINNEIVGSVSVINKLIETDDIEDKVACTSKIMVKPSMQDQGIGTKIIIELSNILKKDYQEIKFLVSKNNSKAIQLYLRLGAVNCGFVSTPWCEDNTYYLFRKKIKD